MVDGVSWIKHPALCQPSNHRLSKMLDSLRVEVEICFMQRCFLACELTGNSTSAWKQLSRIVSI